MRWLNGWVSPVDEKNSIPTNLAVVRGPVSYRIHFLTCRSFSSPLRGNQRSVRVLMESWYRHLLPSLVIETQIFSVLVLVSSLRLRFISLGLIIDSQTFSVLVSSLRLRYFQSWSCHWDSDFFSLDDQNLVSISPEIKHHWNPKGLKKNSDLENYSKQP